jgi:hypothetical protein
MDSLKTQEAPDMFIPSLLAAIRFLILAACLLFVFWPWISDAQNIQYEPFLDVPVTFYDFHSDRSNPEFE